MKSDFETLRESEGELKVHIVRKVESVKGLNEHNNQEKESNLETKPKSIGPLEK
jgi:hypothetical protein